MFSTIFSNYTCMQLKRFSMFLPRNFQSRLLQICCILERLNNNYYTSLLRGHDAYRICQVNIVKLYQNKNNGDKHRHLATTLLHWNVVVIPFGWFNKFHFLWSGEVIIAFMKLVLIDIKLGSASETLPYHLDPVLFSILSFFVRVSSNLIMVF